MASLEHKRLLERLTHVDAVPDDDDALSTWITGEAHLRLLQDDVEGDELIVAAMLAGSGCINTLIVRADDARLQTPEVLLKWSANPYHFSAAEYNWASSGDRTWAEPRDAANALHEPTNASCLAFGRSIDGLSDPTGSYIEVSQVYTHQAGIHWRPERWAYARLDDRGDWDDIVSLTAKSEPQGIALVSFQRQQLDLHLVALESVLVRSFDFTLFRPPFDLGVHELPTVERLLRPVDDLVYRVTTKGERYCRVRGVQIIRPALSEAEAHHLARTGHLPGGDETEPVEFLVLDMMGSGEVVTVSTDPATTRTYFEADRDGVPYETSPAFFRPEVLSKYTADRDKYTLHNGWITCRGAWSLRNYSINDAGQVTAYICYLRDLPHEEQLYWASFNEPPRAGLSHRAIMTDFRAEWPEESTPLEDLVDLLERWRSGDLTWWTWAAEGEPGHLTVPRTGSRAEWAEAFLTLSHAVIEGFRVKALRQRLRDVGQSFEQNDRSIKLLELLLCSEGKLSADERLETLREINEVRVQTKAHPTGRKGRELASAALTEHGSYAAHYEQVCRGLVTELTLIKEAMESR